jgi:hypothetical protein
MKIAGRMEPLPEEVSSRLSLQTGVNRRKAMTCSLGITLVKLCLHS